MNPARESRRLTEKDWTSHEAVIRDLFLKDRLPLRKVKAFMKENHDFSATDRQWKHRIKRWKLDRNIKDHEMRGVIRKRQHRIISEPHRPRLNFRVRGFEVDAKKITRYMKEHDIAEDQLHIGDGGPRTPSDISCYTESGSRPPSPEANMELEDAASSARVDPWPALDPSYESGIERRTHELTLPVDAPAASGPMVSEAIAGASVSPKCRVETVDMTWAFDTQWQELRVGHDKDQEGHPLAALIAMLQTEASEQDWSVPVGTLATLLQETSLEAIRKLRHDGEGSPVIQQIGWDVRVVRKILGDYTLLISAHLERQPIANKPVSWLELRFRIALGDKYYREGHATFRNVYGSLASEELTRAISADDSDEVKRLLSDGEATIYISDKNGSLVNSLFLSASSGRLNITRLLLDRGTPIYILRSIIWDIWDGFSSRWSSGVNPDLQFDEDFARCKELTELAITYGARIDECVQPYGLLGNLLFLITHLGTMGVDQCQQILQYMLQLGVDLEYRNVEGKTPLFWALDFEGFGPCRNMVAALLAAGAENMRENDEGHSPLHGFLFQVLYMPNRVGQWVREALVLLFDSDPRFRQRPITPSETPFFRKLALTQWLWDIWASAFDEKGWDMGQMNEAASQQRLQPDIDIFPSTPDEEGYSDIEEEPSQIIAKVNRWLKYPRTPYVDDLEAGA